MKVSLEIDHTVSKEEITNWIEEVLKPNTPCVWGYSFEEYHCGSCHNSQLEKENAELKARYEKEHSLLNDIIESFTSQSLTDDFEMANTAREIAEILEIKNYR